MSTLSSDIIEINKILKKFEDNLKLEIKTGTNEKNENIDKNTHYNESIQEKLNQFFKSNNLRLNVGGEIFLSSFETLFQAKNSYFDKLLDDKSIDLNNEIFIDRDPTHFALILEFLRNKKLKFKNLSKIQKTEIMKEIDFYQLNEFFELNGKEIFDLFWDRNLSKFGAFTIDDNNPNDILIHSTTCYTHFVTNIAFTDTSFQCELEVHVNQIDDYLYIGIVNENYNFSSNCMCCNPANSWYLQCNGTIHYNSTYITNNIYSWRSNKINIGIMVDITNKTVKFSKEGGNEIGPYTIHGSSFRVVAGHCNTGNGTIKILNCESLRDF